MQMKEKSINNLLNGLHLHIRVNAIKYNIRKGSLSASRMRQSPALPQCCYLQCWQGAANLGDIEHCAVSKRSSTTAVDLSEWSSVIVCLNRLRYSVLSV